MRCLFEAHKGRKKDLASRLIERQSKQSAESSVAALPAIDVIADEEDNNSSNQHSK
jgi:hypothetical protein